MAYGIVATGNNSSFLIDSTTTATEHLTVIATGTVNAAATLTIQAGDFVFAKPYSTTIGSNRVTYNSVSSTTGITFLKKVYYVQLRKAQSASTSGTYGLQVRNAGNTLIYDSRAAASGVKILGSVPRGTMTGAIQPGNGIFTVNDPVSIGNIIHSGDPTNVYINATAGYYFINPYYQIETNSAYYDYANNRILFQGYFYLTGISSTLFTNYADILKGELIT